MLRFLAAIALLVPLAAQGEGRTAEMQVSARVIRSIAVSVMGDAGALALRVRTPSGDTQSAPLASVGVAPYAQDPRYVVVTVLADAPLTATR